MEGSPIWVRVDAAPDHGTLAALHDARANAQADVMYPKRFALAKRLSVGDRIVVHHGGRRRSHPTAQYLVPAGRISREPRPLTPQDEDHYRELLRISRLAWEKEFDLAGIAFYELHAPPPGVGLLPSPRRPSRGDNFIRLDPGSPGYEETDAWWCRVVPGLSVR